MKTDRELLELAAKAAGIKCRWWKVKEWSPTTYASGSMHGRMLSGTSDIFGAHHTKPWNPLSDDGDALRLAVKLNLLYGKVFARNVADNHEDGDDIYAATRRAIVRAAAAIGEAM